LQQKHRNVAPVARKYENGKVVAVQYYIKAMYTIPMRRAAQSSQNGQFSQDGHGMKGIKGIRITCCGVTLRGFQLHTFGSAIVFQPFDDSGRSSVLSWTGFAQHSFRLYHWSPHANLLYSGLSLHPNIKIDGDIASANAGDT